jgi:tRNA-binding EMAP/Myf-like protein
MKVSLNWLKELVDLPADVNALSEILTKAGVEVEGIETRGCDLDHIVVAQILETAQHPNADRLSVNKVADGSAEPRQIVCGAKNFKVGDKVPLALPGAVMPGDFKIKTGKLRGVESAGMMCSAKELGLAEDAEGLLILSTGAVVGTPIKELYPPETVLDVEVTPNRPDLLSHVGMAREIATLCEQPLRIPEVILAGKNTPSVPAGGASPRSSLPGKTPPPSRRAAPSRSKPPKRAPSTPRGRFAASKSPPAPRGCAASWRASACGASTTSLT